MDITPDVYLEGPASIPDTNRGRLEEFSWFPSDALQWHFKIDHKHFQILIYNSLHGIILHVCLL
jgi:hypothetical protein